MNKRLSLLLTVLLFVWLGAAPAMRAGEMNYVMDGLANIRLLDTLFTRYGYKPLKTIRLQDKGIEFRLPPGEDKKIPQTGLYSYVVLVGDFEVEANFEWDEFPESRDGYGMSCGLAVDTNGEGGNAMIARVFGKGGRNGYNVVQGTWQGEGKPLDYKEKKFVASKAKLGGLALRREGDALICLAADGQRQLQEIHRIEPFTKDKIRTFRIYADPGGSPTELHVWMGQLHARAEEGFGGFSKSERPEESSWWPFLVAGSFTVVVGGLLFRWRQQKRSLSETPATPYRRPARPSVK